MEAPKEDVATHIVKGKRTKRQRVQSPIPLLEEEGGGDQITSINVDQDGVMTNSNCWPSPTTANANHFEDATVTDYLNHQRDEDEDMANCLMLLAQGGHPRGMPKFSDHHYSFQDTRAQSNVKFNSRRFLETGSTSSGKSGYYVYECKTCGKTFPSFQALGGHRASHKKLKGLFNDEKKRPATSVALSFNEDDDHYKNISSLSLQLSNNNAKSYRGACNNHSFINTKVKMHECAICGAEFASGQALGGHMRRHRALPVGADDANVSLSIAPTTSLMEPSEFHESNGGRNELSLNLDLDLNLPAQEERASLQSKLQDATQQESQHKKEEEQEKKQYPEQQQQQLPIVIANPTLVDCHY